MCEPSYSVRSTTPTTALASPAHSLMSARALCLTMCTSAVISSSATIAGLAARRAVGYRPHVCLRHGLGGAANDVARTAARASTYSRPVVQRFLAGFGIVRVLNCVDGVTLRVHEYTVSPPPPPP